jgi:hypothetical protein
MFTKRFLSCFLFLATTLGMFAQVPDYAPEVGLQLWCSFNNTLNDEDANVSTISVSPNQCDLAMDRLGNPNSALRLASQQGYVTANYSGAQPIPFVGTSNGLTVNLWYKVAADSVRAILAQCYDDNATNSGGWRITWNKESADNSFIEATYRNGSIDSCSVVATVPSDFYGWHMVTFNVDVAGAGLYIDNDLIAASPWAVSQNMITTGFTNPVIIGNYNGTPAPLTSFVGKIDDVAVWNRALTTTEIDLLYTGETTVAGCTNSNSCTFNEGVTIDDGTCAFFCQGCMDPCACNYDQNATEHIAESCVYDCIVDTVYIQAFLDLDVDGIYDPEETPLENWPINYSGPDSALIFTDMSGVYLLPVRAGVYEFDIFVLMQFSSIWGGFTSDPSLPSQQSLLFPNATIDTLMFGIAPLFEQLSPGASALEVAGNWNEITCTSGYGSGLFVRNTGDEILYGLITLACDPFFMPGADSSETVGPDSVSFGYAEWNIDSLMPGASKLYTFHVEGDLTQVSDYTFNLNLDLNTADGTDVLTQDFQIVAGIDCDPQAAATVSAEPEGAFPPENLILAGETITYRLQYRNVGPGVLDSLRISINLNSDVFDISSAVINYSSEFYSGCLHDDGTLELRMDALMMPDTATDPIGSMGYVLLQVSTLDGLPGGTEVVMEPLMRGLCLHDDGTLELEIPVERYVHHIFNCDSFGAPDGITSENILPVLIDPLIGTDFTIDLCQDSINNLYAEYYNWALPNSNIADSSACTITLSSEGPNEISDLTPVMLIISNSLCADTTEFSIAIPVEEFDASHNIQAYPNPFENRCTVVFTEKFNTIVLYNSLGELIRSWNNQPSSIEIDHNQLSSGAYYLVAHSEQRTARKILIAE